MRARTHTHTRTHTFCQILRLSFKHRNRKEWAKDKESLHSLAAPTSSRLPPATSVALVHGGLDAGHGTAREPAKSERLPHDPPAVVKEEGLVSDAVREAESHSSGHVLARDSSVSQSAAVRGDEGGAAVVREELKKTVARLEEEKSKLGLRISLYVKVVSLCTFCSILSMTSYQRNLHSHPPTHYTQQSERERAAEIAKCKTHEKELSEAKIYAETLLARYRADAETREVISPSMCVCVCVCVCVAPVRAHTRTERHNPSRCHTTWCTHDTGQRLHAG